ncbi:MAG: AlpA family phage regulatory protein [Gammaproteobacteria bacterium]
MVQQNLRRPALGSSSRVSTITADSLPSTGFVRLPLVLRLIPIGKSTWWAGVRSGRYPAPVKLSPHATAWRVEDIRALVDRISNQAGGDHV